MLGELQSLLFFLEGRYNVLPGFRTSIKFLQTCVIPKSGLRLGSQILLPASEQHFPLVPPSSRRNRGETGSPDDSSGSLSPRRWEAPSGSLKGVVAPSSPFPSVRAWLPYLHLTWHHGPPTLVSAPRTLVASLVTHGPTFEFSKSMSITSTPAWHSLHSFPSGAPSLPQSSVSLLLLTAT